LLGEKKKDEKKEQGRTKIFFLSSFRYCERKEKENRKEKRRKQEEERRKRQATEQHSRKQEKTQR
jgi:hypothetical protein